MFIRGDSEINMNAGDVTLCSVEELVLQHYMENGYTHGLHGEGSTLWTVIGLLFWEIIYQLEIDDVFISLFQAMPLDFDTLDFYQSRKQDIEKRLEFFIDGGGNGCLKKIGYFWDYVLCKGGF